MSRSLPDLRLFAVSSTSRSVPEGIIPAIIPYDKLTHMSRDAQGGLLLANAIRQTVQKS